LGIDDFEKDLQRQSPRQRGSGDNRPRPSDRLAADSRQVRQINSMFVNMVLADAAFVEKKRAISAILLGS
jgi:hypothetical protein